MQWHRPKYLENYEFGRNNSRLLIKKDENNWGHFVLPKMGRKEF
jgi:hypothetical protein